MNLDSEIREIDTSIRQKEPAWRPGSQIKTVSQTRQAFENEEATWQETEKVESAQKEGEIKPSDIIKGTDFRNNEKLLKRLTKN